VLLFLRHGVELAIVVKLHLLDSSCFRDIGVLAYWGHEFDLSGHVISSVTWPFDSP